MNLELELHNLKRMVLNESHISDLAKQKIADKIFQIEKGVAINYNGCSLQLPSNKIETINRAIKDCKKNNESLDTLIGKIWNKGVLHGIDISTENKK